MDLDLAEYVPVCSRMDVEFARGCRVRGDVATCHEMGTGYEVRILFEPHLPGHADLRAEPRFKTEDESATVAILGSHQRGPFGANLVDISRSGLGLRLEQNLPMNSWIRVELGPAMVLGEIRHCTPEAGTGYRVGLVTDTVIFRTEPRTDNAASTNRNESADSGKASLVELLRGLKQRQIR